jgi:hypothetical protein
MVLVFRLARGRNIANDINELSFYALLIHLIEIPLFNYTTISSDYHNNAIWILFGLSMVRLMYFGQKTENADYSGLPRFGILGYCQRYFSKITKAPFKYCADILFFGSALPLWFIIYKTNDQAVTITIIGLMLFIYFISDVIKTQSESVAKANANQPNLKADEALLLKLYNEKSIAEKADILRDISRFVAKDFTAAADETVIAAPIINKKRELAQSLIDSYAETHPRARNILVAVNLHFAKVFPKDTKHKSHILLKGRYDWLLKIQELMALGQELNKCKDDLTWGDFSKFQHFFEGIYPGEANEQEGILKGIKYANQFDSLNATDSQIMLAADVLISTWFQLSLLQK